MQKRPTLEFPRKPSKLRFSASEHVLSLLFFSHLPCLETILTKGNVMFVSCWGRFQWVGGFMWFWGLPQWRGGDGGDALCSERCVLLTTYGGPPATPPGLLPLPRVTSPDWPTRPYPHRHNGDHHCSDQSPHWKEPPVRLLVVACCSLPPSLVLYPSESIPRPLHPSVIACYSLPRSMIVSPHPPSCLLVVSRRPLSLKSIAVSLPPPPLRPWAIVQHSLP